MKTMKIIWKMKTMINFYQVWKDGKESEPKVKAKTKKDLHTCIVCSKRVSSIARHMEDVHGKGMWKKYLSAMEAIEQERNNKILKMMGIEKG